jgi:ribosomal protein S3
MGQKVNPIIFRINSKDIVWDSHYYSNTRDESSYYLYQDLAIREALDKIFEKRGAILISCILKRSSTEIKIFIQYYITKAIRGKGLFLNLKRLSILKFRKRLWKKNKRTSKVVLVNNKKTFLKQQIFNRLNQKLCVIKPTLKSINSTKLEQKLGLILIRYTKSLKVSFSFTNIQNNIISKVMRYAPYKTATKKLRGFSRSLFYLEAMELFVLLSEKGNNASLLARFIALKFRFMRKHNFFLTFLKRTLFIFHKVKLAKWQGIKIIISGRFNKKPRAKSQIIQCGTLPLQGVHSRVSYSKTHIYSPVGVFGLKVWVCEKEPIKNVFTTKKN